VGGVMNEIQQKQFYKLAIKFMKSLTENGATKCVHYNFKNKHFLHELQMHFYTEDTWYFEARHKQKFDEIIKFSKRSTQEITFFWDFTDKQIDKFLKELEEYYELWLEDLEKQKKERLDNAINYHEEQLRELIKKHSEL
jgi:hypothetical protein